jgi:hypothetical protein
LSAVSRVEQKLDKLGTDVVEILKQSTPQASYGFPDPSSFPRHRDTTSTGGLQDETTPNTESFLANPDRNFDREGGPGQSKKTPISFSQHRVLFWPAIREQLPQSLFENVAGSETDYAVALEVNRPNLTTAIEPSPSSHSNDWLNNLPRSLITGLSEAYFSSFNPSSPTMDRELYFSDVLSVVLRDGFNYSCEACLVLKVLALSCLAVKAYEDGGLRLPTIPRSMQDGKQSFVPPEWIGAIREEIPGLRFVNESRKRAGFLLSSNDMQSLQYFLLSA